MQQNIQGLCKLYNLPVQVFGGQVQWTTPIFIVVFSGTLHGTALPAKWPSSFGGGLLCGTIGHIEAAIFGAAAGLKEWHHLQHSAAVARAAARPVTAAVQPVLPLAARLLNPMPPAIALVIADTLHQFLLLGVPLSPSEAKAGAVAAAEYLVRQPNIRQRIAQAGLIQNALARATTAAQAVPVGGVAQSNIPQQMFALCPFDRTQ